MLCPYCNNEMTLGRIKVADRIDYRFYPEEKFKGFRNITKALILTDGVRLDKPNLKNIIGSEIQNCNYCEICKKIIIDLEDKS